MPNRTLATLNRQWDKLVATPAANAALARWAAAEPALAGFADLRQLLAGREHGRDVAHDILAALARLAADDELAARVLLQALAPGLVALACGPLAGDPAGLDQLLSHAWERIRTYPTGRSGSVAANVLWDVRKRYVADREIDLALTRPVASTTTVSPSAEDVVLAGWCAEELRSARDRGVIGPVAHDLIARTRFDDVTLVKAAAEQHVGAEWANCVRWRAERRLRPLLAEAS